jgi:hypothetical protein
MLRKFASTCVMVGVLAAGVTAARAQTTPDPHHPGSPAGNKQVQAQPRPSGGMMGPGMMGPGMMGPGMMGPGMMGSGMMERMMGNGQADMMAGCHIASGGAIHTEGRIAFLRAELGITDPQKAVWDAYAAQIKKNLQSMQDMQKMMAEMMDAKSPLERIDARIAVMDKRAQALKEIKPDLATLYAALSADQKGKADKILTGMGCMM